MSNFDYRLMVKYRNLFYDYLFLNALSTAYAQINIKTLLRLSIFESHKKTIETALNNLTLNKDVQNDRRRERDMPETQG